MTPIASEHEAPCAGVARLKRRILTHSLAPRYDRVNRGQQRRREQRANRIGRGDAKTGDHDRGAAGQPDERRPASASAETTPTIRRSTP